MFEAAATPKTIAAADLSSDVKLLLKILVTRVVQFQSESDPNPILSASFGFRKRIFISDQIGLERLFHNWIGSDWMSTTNFELN